MALRSIFTPLRLAIAGAVVALFLITLFLARDTLKRTEPFASLYLDFRAARNGWNRPSDLGDGDPIADLKLIEPTGLAVDREGRVYVGDRGTHLVWRLTPDGRAEVFAGTGGRWPLTPGPALLCDIDEPEGLSFAPDGSLFIALEQKHMVVKIDTHGVLHKVTGLERRETSGDGGPASQAGLDYPTDVACAPDGTVYIATKGDGHVVLPRASRIRAIGTDGIIRTVIGGGDREFSEGMAATDLNLAHACGVLAGNDRILVTHTLANQVLELIDGRLHLVAGTGERGYAGDGGDAKLAQLDAPQGLRFDREGRLLIGDEHNKCVRRIELDGTLRTIFGRGHPAGAPVELADPEHVAVAQDGSIYVTDGPNRRVWRLAPDGSATVFAGRPPD